MTVAGAAIRVPLFEPEFGRAEEDAVVAVLRSGWIAMGPRTAAFEQAFAARLGVRHAIAVNSCTAALHLANMLAGVGPGDEVIVPSLTFAATANAVVYCGGTPVFADIAGPDDWCIDPAHVARLIGPRTKAVVAMHYAGFPSDMAALSRICAERGVTLLEDACHGLGGTIEGRAMGTIGAVGCFSFYSNKMFTTAEGGMLVTDDDAMAARARRLRSHGMTATAYDRERGAMSYDIEEIGHNYRLDDLRAAVGLAQLDRLDGFLERRERLFELYRQHLAAIAGVRLPEHGRRGRHATYLMPVLIERADRDTVRRLLAARGVQTSVHYQPVHTFRHYQRQGVAPLPNTEHVGSRCITLPLYPTLSEDAVAYVCESLAAAVAEAG